MRNISEYDLENPATWKVLRQADVITDLDFKWFSDQLIRIAGMNPFRQPNLALRWGCTYLDPMDYSDKPKYYLSTNNEVLIAHQFRDDSGTLCTVEKLEEVPSDKVSLPVYSGSHLGERRFIVEQWGSAEFLERTGRYALRRDREDGELLLRELPRQGCYDYFFRIERQDGTYHPPDGRALEAIESKWQKQLRPFKEKDTEIKDARARAETSARKRRHEIWHPDNLLQKETYADSN